MLHPRIFRLVPEKFLLHHQLVFSIYNAFECLCVVSNAAVIIALYRSGNKFIRPGLSMLCSLSITDLLWGATVAPVESGLRLKHLLNSQVCEMYSEFSKIPFISPPVVLYICTIFNLTIVSIDRFLAVKHFAQYRAG